VKQASAKDSDWIIEIFEKGKLDGFLHGTRQLQKRGDGPLTIELGGGRGGSDVRTEQSFSVLAGSKDVLGAMAGSPDCLGLLESLPEMEDVREPRLRLLSGLRSGAERVSLRGDAPRPSLCR
jgi:hypothetical protein